MGAFHALPTLTPTGTVLPAERGTPVAFARYGPAIQQRSFSVELPALPPGRHSIDIEFEMARSLDAGAPWTGSLTTTADTVLTVVDPDPESGAESDAPRIAASGDLDLDLDADPASVLPFPAGEPLEVAERSIIVPEPVDDPAMAAIISRVFDNGIVQWADGSLPVRITINRRRTHVAAMNDVAVGLEVELRRNGRLGRTLELWWMAGNVPSRANEWEVPFVDDAVLLPPATDEDRWELVVRSREDLALRVPGAHYRWSGEFTRPVPIVSRRGMAPSRGWIPVPLPDAAVRSENPRSSSEPRGSATLVGHRSDAGAGPSPAPGRVNREG